MSQLVKFGDVVLKVNDKVDPQEDGLERYVAGEHMVTDDPFLREYGLVGDGYLGPAFQMRFKPGHILYGSRRTYLRKVAMSSFEGVCANTTFVLRPVNDKLAKEFLLHVMSTERFHTHSILQSKGSVNPYINFSDLVDYEFELPSLDEQARIVELMTAVDEHLDALRSQLEVAKGSRAAVLHQLLSVGGRDWAKIAMDDIFQLSNKKLGPHNEEPAIFAVSKYDGVVLAQDYFDKRIASKSLDGYKVIEVGDWVYSTIHIDEGSIAVNHFPFTGVVSPMYTSLSWNSENHDPRFFEYLLKSARAIVQYKENAQGTVNRRRSLSWKTFSGLKFDVPSLAEQKRIVEIVSSMDVVIQATEQAIVEAKVLRTTLLNQEIS